ncbi:hypothetical protein Phum_PHUM380230 [Pediculus humanus corporis]|uniref:Uncharacterized protein n=1 Tax=Pediculus humanus subsp. corporis TaxID=121224 RepID=E0VQN2_PEDHC|nr:uncharacterized protein Phum_PHUM380230 [Pediculus humanus corporis]EEB15688.1 hypothetical protein Phum_PHUM380230 [Pediculus humanus corporis]
MDTNINSGNVSNGSKVTSPRSSGNNLTAPGSYIYTSSANILSQREKPPLLPKYQGYTSSSAAAPAATTTSSYRLSSFSGRTKISDTAVSGDPTTVRFLNKRIRIIKKKKTFIKYK